MIKEFKIGSKTISGSSPAFIIAEIGVNHNGSLDMAKKLISEAKICGADAVKFQTFSAEKLVVPDTPKANYQKDTTPSGETHYEMLKKLELTKEDHISLMEYCAKEEIIFISTPYDILSAKFLLEFKVPCIKTASIDIADLPLQEYLAKSGVPVLVSTGMSTLGEVEEVMKLYSAADHNEVVLLHCVSNYPCSIESLNMRVIETIRQAFDVNVGFSDHSIGADASIVAVALGATVIEKHFTLDKSFPGPDQKASSLPSEFKDLVLSVRNVEKMLGSSIKRCQPEEEDMAYKFKKSIVLNKNINKGEVFTAEHLTLKRPGSGLRSGALGNFIGKKARSNLDVNHIMEWSDLGL